MRRNRSLISANRTPPRVNSRNCPGSYALVHADRLGYAVCTFCNNEFRVNNNGTLKGHKRPK